MKTQITAKQDPGNPSPAQKIARKSKAGSTMVEGIVALVVFAMFVTGASKMFITHRQMSDMARAHYTAANMAKNRLELARTFEFGQIGDFLENGVLVDASGFPDRDGNYRRSTELGTVSTNLYELIVTVEIRDRKTLGFEGRNENLSTYFAEYLTEESSVGGGVAPDSTS